MKHAIRSFLALALVLVSARAQSKPGAAEVAGLLEKSGYNYTKVSDGVWEIQFKGKNIGEFPVRVAVGADILVTLAKIADRKELKLQPAFLTKLLELNDSIDSVKIVLSDEMLYVRMDTRLRAVDAEELKYILGQISGAVDEIYPQIKQYLPK
ncbi:MAG TPA: hypothetical protein VGV35_00245 [Bryobacteraceae bacterium]|nr:hypothetical protein [Bryobacteraceae bacterium]